MLVNILIGLGLLILLALTFAPLESLGWWAREGADEAAACSGDRDHPVPRGDYDDYVVTYPHRGDRRPGATGGTAVIEAPLRDCRAPA